MKRLPKSPYYEIKLVSSEFLNKNAKLIIDPKPDTQIRLLFYFKPIKKLYTINEPKIITPERQGFTVVEWGGILG